LRAESAIAAPWYDSRAGRSATDRAGIVGERTVVIHRYESIDSSYFDVAPVRLDTRRSLGYPTDVVWKIFEDNAAWETFTPGIAEATWTSPPPLHSGSTRRVRFSWWLGRGVVDEVFFEWRPVERFAFYMHEGTSRLIQAYGELWSFEDLGRGRTEIRLRTAFSLHGRFKNRVAGFLSPVVNVGFKRVLTSVERYLRQHHPA